MKKNAGIKEFSSIKLHLLKLISLIMAFFIWFYVLNSEPMSVTIKMAVNVSTTAGTAVGSVLPEYVNVEVKGPRVFIRNLKEEEQKIFLQIKVNPDELPIKKSVKILESAIRLPLGISVESIKPGHIPMEIEKKIKKYVPIIPNYVGAIDSKYRIIKKSLLKDRVLIEGPIETMRKISKVRTKPIDLSLITNSGEIQIALEKVDSRVRVRDHTVGFKYTLRPKTANLLLKKIRIRFISSFQTVLSKTRYASLSVLVEEGKEKNISAADVQVMADIKEERRGRYSVKLSAQLPDNVHLLEIFPATINVSVR